MVALTTSGLNCSDQCNCNLITRHVTFVPLWPPSPSFLPLIGLCEVRILLIGRHLVVFAIFLSQRGVGIRYLRAGCNKGCNDLFIWGSKATDLMFLSHNSVLQVFSLLCRGILSWLLRSLPYWLWSSCGLVRVIPFALGKASRRCFLNT